MKKVLDDHLRSITTTDAAFPGADDQPDPELDQSATDQLPRGKGARSTAPPTIVDLNYAFYGMADLVALRIVTSRQDVFHRLRNDNFPPPIRLGHYKQSRPIWRRADIHRWIDERAAQQTAGRSGAAS